MESTEIHQSRTLVPYVTAVVGEGVASAVSAGVALTVLLACPATLTEGLGALGQTVLVVAAVSVWAVGLLVGRRRLLEAGAGARPIPDPRQTAEAALAIRKNLRRGYLRNAVLAAVLVPVFGLWFGGVGLGLVFPLFQLSGLISAVSVTRWQRRQGVVLWKPALSAVGREAHRASPFYATAART